MLVITGDIEALIRRWVYEAISVSVVRKGAQIVVKIAYDVQCI